MKWKKRLTTLAALGGLSALAIHVTNKLIYFSSTIDNLLSNTDGHVYEWRFGNIFYTKQGSGEPILLLHDLTPVSSGYEWNKIVSELSKTNTVYTLDLLGCGRSDKPSLTYTNYFYVQMVCDFIKHIVSKKCSIVATGDSSSIALMSALNDKEIISQILLINPSDLNQLSTVPTKRTKSVKFLLEMPLLGTLLYNIIMRKDSIDTTFLLNYFYEPEKITPEIIRTYHESAHKDNSHSKYLFASIKGRFTNVNISQCLKSLNNSIFILASKGNPENERIAREYKELIPSIEIATLSKVKHLPQLEDPKQVLEQISILFSTENL